MFLWYFGVISFSCIGVFSVVSYVVSRMKKISLEEAAAIVWDWMRKELGQLVPEREFVLNPSQLEQLVKIAAKHSRLDFDNTIWSYSESEVRLQILPQNQNSMAAATEEAKIYIRNVAAAANYHIDVESDEMPYHEHSRILSIRIASTAKQKEGLAKIRYERAHLANLQAEAGLQPFMDEALQSWPVQLGYDAEYRTPIYADFRFCGHLALIGGTGSGKTTVALFCIYKLLGLPVLVELYIADFKRSRDFLGISEHYADGDGVVGLIDEFYQAFEDTPEGYSGLKILIVDELAGLLNWAQEQPEGKSLVISIQNKLGNLFMLGRSRHCYVWCVQQRISAAMFKTGSGVIDNVQIRIGMSALSPDSKRSLFPNEWPEDTPFMQTYKPGPGRGLILIDGQLIRPYAVPEIPDKAVLLMKCQERARANARARV